jgi:hypothetical protein
MSQSLGGGLARAQLAQQVVSHSLRDAEDELLTLGYEPAPTFVERTPRGDYKATAYGGPAGKYRAQAIGNTPVAAAQSLIRTIKR